MKITAGLEYRYYAWNHNGINDGRNAKIGRGFSPVDPKIKKGKV